MTNMTNQTIDIQEMKDVFSVIGLANDQGQYYQQRIRKHQQVFEFIKHLNKAVDKMSKKRALTLVDCACGRSYLSFIANYYFTYVKERQINFICVDYNEHVIKVSEAAAETLGFNNMTFICDDIFNVKLQEKPDIVYSLHACDTATDMTVAKGILEQAQHIMTVSCCQHSVRKHMKKHPLGSISRHGVYKERLADMVADSMRALILESRGYGVKVFDYVASTETPKNVMIRAMRTGNNDPKRQQICLDQYDQLRTMFQTEVALLSMMERSSSTSASVTVL